MFLFVAFPVFDMNLECYHSYNQNAGVPAEIMQRKELLCKDPLIRCVNGRLLGEGLRSSSRLVFYWYSHGSIRRGVLC